MFIICSGYHGYRQGDKTSADIRTEASQSSGDDAMTTTASLDTISEDDHEMPAPPLPSSSVNTYNMNIIRLCGLLLGNVQLAY